MTMKYNPSMLKLAREYRGLSHFQIAWIIDKSTFRAKRLETEWGIPSEDELKRLSDGLDFPEDFFFQESDPIMTAPVFMCKIDMGESIR